MNKKTSSKKANNTGIKATRDILVVPPNLMRLWCNQIGIGSGLLDDEKIADIARRVAIKVNEIKVYDDYFKIRKRYIAKLQAAIQFVNDNIDEEISIRLQLKEYLGIFATGSSNTKTRMDEILNIKVLGKLKSAVVSTTETEAKNKQRYNYSFFRTVCVYYLEDMIRIIFKSYGIRLGFSSEAGKGTMILSHVLENCKFGPRDGFSPEALIKMKKRFERGAAQK